MIKFTKLEDLNLAFVNNYFDKDFVDFVMDPAYGTGKYLVDDFGDNEFDTICVAGENVWIIRDDETNNEEALIHVVKGNKEEIRKLVEEEFNHYN